jgi:Mn2+/Fe2+ NRAMP family transporter
MVGEIKELQLGLAGGVVFGLFMLFLGMSGTCGSAGQGFYGMMGLPGNGCSLTSNIIRLAFGAIIGFIGGAAIALIYNYLSNATK